MKNYTYFHREEHKAGVESNGIILCLEQKGRDVLPGMDIMYPYIILSLNLEGTSHSLYDLKELRTQKNDLTVFLPGHIIHPLEHSENYRQAWLLFDPSKFADSDLKISSSEIEYLYQAPLCHLTEEQAQILYSILGVINYILTRTEEDLPNKHRLLEAQLSLAYELYMSIRQAQDKLWSKDRVGNAYLKFCNLVVTHYKFERNVNYYARILGYDARYFSKIFRDYNNGISPHEWIQNYVITMAKQLMYDHPDMSVKEITTQLGFPNTANFCRYFKQVTGMTPSEYKEKSAL